MSANDYLIESLTRHQIFLQRFGGGQINELMPVLDQMSRDIRLRLLEAGTDFQVYRLQTLLNEIDGIIQEAGGSLGRQLEMNLTDFARYESDFMARLLREVADVDIAVPAPNQLASAVTQSVARLVQGDRIVQMSVPQLVEQFTSAKRQQVLQAVRAGFIEGQPIQTMVSRVTDITDKAAKRQAGAMIRTAVNHMGSQARQKTYAANEDVLEGLERVGTLDGRTSLQCIAGDGQIYPVNTTNIPPYHFGCRTVLVPRVKDQFTLFKGTGKRASKDGPVSAKVTYGGFLKRQSKEFQNEVLGTERAKLFRSGKVSVGAFVDESGRTLTLDELRRREGLTLQND